MSVGALVHSTPKLNYITHPLCTYVLRCGNSKLCCYRPHLFTNSWSPCPRPITTLPEKLSYMYDSTQ